MCHGSVAGTSIAVLPGLRKLSHLVLLVPALIACTPGADPGGAGAGAEIGVAVDAGIQSDAPPTGSGSGGGGSVDAGTSGGGSVDAGSSGGGGAGAIWHPTSGTTWQWQLTGTIDTTINAAVYDIDLVDAPQSVIDKLHADHRKVICYFSAGTYESWRPDASQFPAAVRGNGVDGWPGENWLDTRSAVVRAIMQTRLDLAVAKHCDGVEPDNIDGYQNNPGFPLSSATQLDFNMFLATQAHQRGLSIGLKNDLDQIAALVASFDWAVDEECAQYGECGLLHPFVAADKAVFHCEYTTSCPPPVAGLSTILKSLDLDAPRIVCP